MNERLEKLAIQAFGLIGGYPTYATNSSELNGLIRKLRPVLPGIDLVRLGPNGDGGYLVSDDFAGIEACFSPGVAACSDFEKDCAERGMLVFMADKSVDAPATAHAKFSFIKKHIGAITGGDFITMDDWVETSLPGSQSDLMLQMDIEGYEYQAFLGMTDTLLSRFRIMVVEFHDLPRLWSLPYYSLASVAFARILKNHVCVHIHPNTCCGSITRGGTEIPRIMEFTFLRRDRVRASALATTFPHPLDSTNGTGSSSLPLPRCWYCN